MYKIIVVDDEPTAIDFVRTLVERKAPDFQIVATAGNGRECLDLLDEYQPDIVISDIRMPLMDGIELIKHINSDYPHILTLLISGYEEFEYARQALKYNAVDYIKKPVVPRVFAEVMGRMKTHLDRVFGEERNRAIRNLTKGIQVSEHKLSKYFPEDEYYAILIRKNGLPRRFLGTQEIEIFSEVYESIIVYGRDEMEALYIITRDMMIVGDKKTLPGYIQMLIDRDSNHAAYTTAIATREPLSREDFSDKLRQLYRALDTKTKIGRSQVIYVEDCLACINKTDNSQTEETREKNTQLIKKLEHYLTLQQKDRVRQEVKKAFKLWQENGRTQLQVEELINQILFLLRNFGLAPSYGSGIEYDIEDAFYNAPDMDTLAENIDQLLFGDNEDSGSTNSRIDTPEFFEMVKAYIKNSMASQLSLQSTARQFTISQTYLSKMFRKYEDKSFNNYLTAMRMEEAKRLMKNEPDLYIKDIASMVGYNDQFYFSRIFRSYTGVCPSDFLAGSEG
jgi:YesN/AraC family two-component response regulator